MLLRRMRGVEFQIRTDLASPLEDLRVGMRYVVNNPIVWTLLILGLVLEVFGWNYQQILAEMVVDSWEYSRTSWAFVDLAGGIGVLVPALILSLRRDIKSQPRLMMAAYICMAVSVMFFAWSPWLVLFAVLMAIAYFMRTSFYAIMDTLLQTRVSDEMRGRVLGLQFVLVAFSNTRIWRTWSISSQPGGLLLGVVGAWTRWAFISFLGVKMAITLGSGIVASAGLIMLTVMSATYREEPATESED
jgi:MFS family permease